MSMRTAKQYPNEGSKNYSLFDRFVGAFNPGHLVKRHQAQMLSELTRDGLLGRSAFKSSETDRLNQNWKTSNTEINTVLRTELKKIRNRSRYVCRNTADGPGAVNAIVNFVVGTGMTPQSLVGDQFAGGVNDFTVIQETQENFFNSWAKNVDIAANPQCPQSFADSQRLVMRCVFEDGEAFIHQAIDKSRPDVPLYYEFIPPESLDTSINENPNSGQPIDMGIEYNGNSGRSLAYWVQSKVQGRSESRRIPADQMLHIYDVLYPGQRRGLPWMFAVLGKFFQMDELLDAELIGSKIAACFSVFFTGPTSNQTQVTEGGNAKDANGNILSHIQPGLMSWLPEGTDVSFAQPQKPGATFGQFMELLERKVGSGTHAGMSYEALTRDTSKTNFAGIRASQQMDFQAWRPIQKWLARKYCRPTWDKVIDLGVMTGALDAPGYDNPLIGSSFWQVHEWVPSGWHFGVNPAQEVAASRDAIRAGLTNLAHESGLLGIDWRTNLRMTARVQKMSEDLGLVLTSDAAYSTVNGVESEAVPLAKVESAADKTAGGSADA